MKKVTDILGISLLVYLCGCVEFEVLSATDTLTDPNGTEVGTNIECSEDDTDTWRFFYPDCDGDGVFSSIPTMACDLKAAAASFECLDGGDPDDWSVTQGNDCNDEDATVSSNGIFYPDCDADGVFSSSPTKACGAVGADLAFDCQDGTNPDGGWAKAPGTDCNDEDKTGSAFQNWYSDCDGDGQYSPSATQACGVTGANAAFDCADGGDPDGGWSSTVGTDCNDDGKNTC